MATVVSKRKTFINLQLKIIESKEEFELIISDKPRLKAVPRSVQTDPDKKSFEHSTKNQNIFNSVCSKEDIVVPRHGKISNPEQFRSPNAKSRPDVFKMGYHRLKIQHNLPSPFVYEITQRDRTVMEYFQERYVFSQKSNFKLQEKDFILIFKMCEDFFYSKDPEAIKMLDPQNLANLKVVENFGDEFSSQEKTMLMELVLHVIQYWKIQKKGRFNEPLIRKYWQKNSSYLQGTGWVPYKTRRPGILEPPLLQNELKLINSKLEKATPQKTEVISTMKEWDSLYNAHCLKRKEFQNATKSFHLLASNYGFKKSFEKVETFSKKNENSIETSYTSSSFQTSFFNESSDFSFNEEISKVQPQKREILRKPSLKTGECQEKLKKRERCLPQNSLEHQKNEFLDSIEISDDCQQDLSFVDSKKFDEWLIARVEKTLGKQIPAFRLNMSQKREEYEIDSDLGSENFNQDMNWAIKEPEDFFNEEGRIKSKKYQKQMKYSCFDSDEETFYENSSELVDTSPVRSIKPKDCKKAGSNKKVKQ